jgi:hypothetical protein
LVYNVEKTALVPIGHNGPLDPEIAAIGFTLQTDVTILGLKIKGDSYDFSETFEGLCTKMRKIIHQWKRFNLSLPGRINIAKCFLYSQVNYLGCFLKIPNNYIQIMEEIILNFVTGNLKIAKKRIYLKPEEGGLGLFHLKEFLEAQHCQWVKRSKVIDEIWKQKLFLNMTNKQSIIGSHHAPSKPKKNFASSVFYLALPFTIACCWTFNFRRCFSAS